MKRSFNPCSRLPKPAFHRTCSADRQSGGQVSWRKIILLLLIGLFITTIAFGDWAITRGPDIGEIYFIGPTATTFNAIYYSTDFGETAVCVDSISEVESICADLTPGSLYRGRMPNCLYYSNNYGQYGSWVFRTSEGSYVFNSGRNEGEIFKGAGMSSNDYGISFTQHSFNGCFCNGLQSYEIDNQDSIGYYLGSIWGINDTLWLFISNDNFENLEIQHIFNWQSSSLVSISRGTESGELYLRKSTIYVWEKELWYSDDYGENWIFKNNLISSYFVGGRQPGEIYVLANYIQLMGQIAHTYIYHSLDYGETFTVYHPFSYGPPPYYANFEAESTSGEVPLTVQFTDLSSGENIESWEWDFDNDGTVDSYEQNPEYTYQDTGSYTVKLTIQYFTIEDGFIRTNYIHVTDGQGCDEHNIQNHSAIKLSNYPNPFKQETVISYELPPKVKKPIIEIYNVKGQLIKQFIPIISEQKVKGKNIEVVWDGRDESRKYLSSGIYFYKLNIKSSTVKKMILLR